MCTACRAYRAECESDVGLRSVNFPFLRRRWARARARLSTRRVACARSTAWVAAIASSLRGSSARWPLGMARRGGVRLPSGVERCRGTDGRVAAVSSVALRQRSDQQSLAYAARQGIIAEYSAWARGRAAGKLVSAERLKDEPSAWFGGAGVGRGRRSSRRLLPHSAFTTPRKLARDRAKRVRISSTVRRTRRASCNSGDAKRRSRGIDVTARSERLRPGGSRTAQIRCAQHDPTLKSRHRHALRRHSLGPTTPRPQNPVPQARRDRWARRKRSRSP